MSYFTAKMHQIRFRLGLCPRPRWGSLQRRRDGMRLEGGTGGEGGKGEEERKGWERRVPKVTPAKNPRYATAALCVKAIVNVTRPKLARWPAFSQTASVCL